MKLALRQRRRVAFGLFLSLMASAHADETSTRAPWVTFEPFPIPAVRTHVWADNGTPAGKAEMDSPFPDDFPPSLTVAIEDARAYPALKKEPRYFIPGRNVLRVYRIVDVKKAPYKTIQPEIEQLKRLLIGRWPTDPRKGGDSGLPDYPPRNAGHLIECKISYLDAPWGSGVFYITQFVQGTGEQPDNEELTYLFQGLSNDGRFYVSADFRISHPRLPAGIDSIDPHSNGEAATRRAQAFLQKEADESFTPSLGRIRRWVGTLKVE